MINEKRDEENELLPLIPTVASYYGAYTRLYTLVYLEQVVDIFEKKISTVLEREISEDEKNELQSIKAFIEDFSRLIIEQNLKGKTTDVVMPYSEPHRKKVHLSQALCVIMKVFTKSELFFLMFVFLKNYM